MKLLLTCVAVVSVWLLSGCFTGIESTPKITADDSGKEIVKPTAEELFMDDVAAEPFDRWTVGKTFVVTDSKISIAFGASASGHIPEPGERLYYDGSREVVSVTNRRVVELMFVDSLKWKYVYRTNAEVEALARRPRVEVPFTIECSVVDAVSAKLKGRTMYVRTSVWYDTEGNLIYGRKFVPVTIVDVLPGNSVFPVTLVFTDDTARDKERRYHIYMSVGQGRTSPRTLAALFYFENPRSKYPEITDENWARIVDGRIAAGMTRQECRLSLGAPREVDRRPGYDHVREVWSYDDGAYLIFIDGVLQDFRK